MQPSPSEPGLATRPDRTELAPGSSSRRTVTILFADVSGSTALGERLDPELLRTILRRYFAVSRTVVERHGGTVEKFIGDAVMAVFGLPVLHEDDALRAVRAAAELRTALTELDRELAEEFGVRLGVRIAINTGEVLASPEAHGETLVTGDMVNTAARLEQVAAAGEVVLGGPTLRIVRSAVIVDDLGPRRLKGKADAVEAYRLVSVDPGAESIPRRLEAPLIARTDELERLRSAFDDAREAPACRLVTVVGAPGVGKSRLVRELTVGVADEARVIRGRCLPYGDGITFWPIAEMVRAAAGISATDRREVALARLADLLTGAEQGDAIAARVASLIGLSEGSASTEEIAWAFRRLIEHLSMARPLVVVIDDLQWAEPALAELFEGIVEQARDAAILVVAIARPELPEVHPTWLARGDRTEIVWLEPLSGAETDELLDALVDGVPVGTDLRARIQESADGNPLFVEQLVAMLIDDGVLTHGTDGALAATASIETLAIPPTIGALLAARLDRLPGLERRLLVRASVIGRTFWSGALADLVPDTDRTEIGAGLESLVRRRLIRPDESLFVGDEAFRFRHLLVRDAAYASLPKADRAELHQRFADWLESRVSDRLAEYEEIVGYHLEQATLLRRTLGIGRGTAELAVRAGHHLAAAGVRASDRDNIAAAVGLLGRAVDLLPADDELRDSSLFRLSTALLRSGDFGRSVVILDDLIERSDADGRRGLAARLRIVRLRATSYSGKLDWSEILAAANAGLPLFEADGDEEALSYAWAQIAYVYGNRGQAAAEDAAMERAIAHARRSGDDLRVINLLTVRADRCVRGPQPVSTGLAVCDEVMRSPHLGLSAQAWTITSRAQLLAMSGAIDEAWPLFEAARRTAADVRLLVPFLGADWPIAYADVCRLTRDATSAERELRMGHDLLAGFGERFYLSTVDGHLARALRSLGRSDEAFELTAASERNADDEDVDVQMRWRSVRARLLADRGRIAEALALGDEIAEFLDGQEFVTVLCEALGDRAEIAVVAGRPDDALTALDQVIDLCRRKGNRALLAITEARRAEIAIGR